MQADTGIQQEQQLGAPQAQSLYFEGRATRMVLKRPGAAQPATTAVAPPPPLLRSYSKGPPPPPPPGGWPAAPGPPMDVE